MRSCEEETSSRPQRGGLWGTFFIYFFLLDEIFHNKLGGAEVPRARCVAAPQARGQLRAHRS